MPNSAAVVEVSTGLLWGGSPGTGKRSVVPGKVTIVRVSSHSLPKAVAGAVAGMIRSGQAVELQAVGAGAVNQAVKAIAVARVFLAEEGVDLVSVPRFLQIAIDGEDRMAIGISVERR